ncbi:MAG: V-type ATP synthase subunit I [Halobacteriaceae archaeon]
MLRPERMSKVSVTGSRPIMTDVIEAIHDLNLVHLSEYGGEWEGFDQGNPYSEADELSEKLVTVRSLKSILDISEDDAGPTRIVTDEALQEDLESIRQEVNELDDQRSTVEDQIRDVEEQIAAMEPFTELGIDLDLLHGYDSLEVVVGKGSTDAVEDALQSTSGIRTYEIMTGGETIAIFVYPEGDTTNVLEDALVGVDFEQLEIPDAEGSPDTYLEELEHEREVLVSKLNSIEDQLEELRLEHAGFLLAAEEKLSIKVQKKEAPLQFATTENAFIAEGWIPTNQYATLVEKLQETVGDRVEIEELERATYTPSHGHESEAVTDGGIEDIADDEPPVVQDNPNVLKPFELLVETINRPRYYELDPTVILFLTFPAFYGFMIGDFGYGILYTAIGYWLWTDFDSDAFRSLGGIAMWAGGFTMLFGILYGEIFGFHFISKYFWQGLIGLSSAPMHKGLHAIQFAQLWLTLSILLGLIHLTVGWVFGFINDKVAHGTKEAILEDASWIFLMIGIWIWIFSKHGQSQKPEFLYTVFAGKPVPLGFEGFPPIVGIAGLVLGLIGLVLIIAGEGGVGFLESPNTLVNVISYTRIAAVLLAKAGMAYVVNLLVFGAYQKHHEIHFMLSSGTAPHGAEVIFPGIVHGSIVGAIGGFVILIVGHLLVLALGVTSAGLQAVRLEYVEFFNKFYDGGGSKYQPFGQRRTYTTED